jgi:hypothetical protein
MLGTSQKARKPMTRLGRQNQEVPGQVGTRPGQVLVLSPDLNEKLPSWALSDVVDPTFV